MSNSPGRPEFAAALKAVFRPMFRGFDEEICAIKDEAQSLTRRVDAIERKVGMDRAIDALTKGKGE